MPYAMKPLPFDPAKLQGLSERLIVSHYENNYGGAAKRLTAIRERLGELNIEQTPGFAINGLKREELIAANSTVLHELYFDGLGGDGTLPGALAAALARDFGSAEKWRSEFVAMGKALGGGSGWVILTWASNGQRLVNQWASDHTQLLAGGTPILALDMFEHSYHLDYGAGAGAYVDAYMRNIRWAHAEALYQRCSQP